MASRDILISTFAQHDHPLVLVEYHALRWMSARPMFKENEFDLLIAPRQQQSIIDDLLRSGLWSHVPHDRSTAGDIPSLDHLLPEDRAAAPRLLSTDGALLTLWPEHIYHLSVADTVQHNIQVPDFYSLEAVLVEESMCPEDRVPRGRLMSERNAAISEIRGEPFTPTPHYPDTPLFIPPIADFLQACCVSVHRLKEAGARRLMEGRFGRQGPRYYLSLMIRYLWLERDSQRAKLRAVILDERVWDELQQQLDGYVRTNKRTMVMTKGGKIWPPYEERREARKREIEGLSNGM